MFAQLLLARQVGAVAPVVSNLAYDSGTDRITFDVDQNDVTAYFMLTASATPVSGSAIEAGTGAVANSTGSFAIASGPASYDPPFENVADGSYWLHLTCKKNGVYSTDSVLAVTLSSAPVNTVAPAITGTEQVGQTLTCSTGTWTGSPSGYAYQWQVSNDGSTGWANISGATASTYVPVSGDQAKYLRCVVTATNASGSTPANSNVTGQIAAASSTPQRVSTLTGQNDGDGGGIDIAIPAGVQSGDRMILLISRRGDRAVTISGPVSFASAVTQTGQDANNDALLEVFSYTCTGSESGTIHVADNYKAISVVFLLIRNSSGYRTSAKNIGPYGTTATAPDLTAAANDLIYRCYPATVGTWTTPAGTLVANLAGNSNQNFLVMEEGPVSAGSVGTKSATLSASVWQLGVTVAVGA